VFAIEYDLQGTGWAYLTVTTGDVSQRMEISYIGPDLTDLVWETAKLLAGATSATIEFMTEPGEHLWTIERDGDEVDLHIKSEVEVLLDADKDEWREDTWSLATRVPLQVFAAAVLDTFDRMLATHGVDGYKKRWCRDLSGQGSADAIRAALQR
jgi:hypothetical protein